MDTKVDPRSERMDAMIRKGLLNMLEEKDYGEITVTDISQSAGISRKTFYAHYDNKNILYDQMVSEAIGALCEKLIYCKEEDDLNYYDNLKRDVTGFLTYMEENRDTLMHILHPTLYEQWYPLLESTIIMKKKELYIKTGSSESERDIPYRLLFDTICSTLVVWIYWWLSEEKCTIDQGAEYLSRLMNRSMINIFRYTKPARFAPQD